jgi:hypothetical protein
MTLVYEEMPRHLEQYVTKVDGQVPDELLDEYVSVISKYKKNTEIVPKFELEKYIKKRKGLLAKAEARSKMKQLPEEVKEMFDEAVAELKKLKVKYTIDDSTSLPTFTQTKTKNSVAITYEQIEVFESAEEIIGYVKGSILTEEKNEDD